MKLSLCMMTLDGADRIEKCLLNFVGMVDQIVICVDDKTVDSTREVAAKITNEVYDFTFVHWGQAKDNMLQYLTGDWILLMDDDEDMSIEDIGMLKTVIETAPLDVDLYVVPRRHWLDLSCTKLDETRPYPDYQLRLHRNVDYIKCGNKFAHASPSGYNKSEIIPYDIHINHYNKVYHDRDWHLRRYQMYDELFHKYEGISYLEFIKEHVNPLVQKIEECLPTFKPEDKE